MTIDFQCPHCGSAMQVGEQFAGTTGPCRNCNETIMIPAMTTTSQSAPPPAPSKGSGTIIIVLAVVCGVGLLGMLLLVALLLPAVNAAREAARRASCINNVKMITLALLQYESDHGTLPPAYTVDENGQPLHSWRVLILPYLEEPGLYHSLDLSKPWDDPVNAQLREYMPSYFRCPSGPADLTETHYSLVVGPETAFPGSEALSMKELKDGVSRTLVVVESQGKGFHWASPQDVTADEFINGNSSHHPGGFVAGFADGHVEFVSEASGSHHRRAISTRAGGD